MTEPTTVNTGLVVANTGDLVDLWATDALNPNFSALDGYFGGVQTITVSNAPITLTSPASFTPTPSGGPVQSQNAVLRFTGTLTSGVQVTLPVPGYYIIDNSASGNFVLSFRAIGSGAVIAIDQGDVQHIYNDGTNVKFVNFGRIGAIEMWAGYSAMPAWVTACTNVPYLLCDGTIYNISAFPVLGNRLLAKFGGNGLTTFAVPDLSGRVSLPYDQTGTRITVAGSGINGQSIGASADNQSVTLTANQIPTINSNRTQNITVTFSNPVVTYNGTFSGSVPTSGGFGGGFNSPANVSLQGPSVSTSNAISVTSNNTGGALHTNVQPSLVTGIPVIRAA